MDQIESNTHSFIIKVWLEETAVETHKPLWHGYISHVGSGRRRYLKNLDEIKPFLAGYLSEMGVKLGFWARLRAKRQLKH
ncbi:MAG: hypothetical protein HXX08_22720 [Chloroflexi bacterium]|uniref:Uncharacterized protein n=1 Tax=Candidatus Chlorohelix allophototropha TaxID=3003348 RepID=A0A8T7M9E3_9CHLR|nr:hypothetical protein [Chloroflexota bacterium]WJW68615.1 hypothetical protein OZ401_004229 [Chloroflexota bacterium L227-S17]